MKKESYRVLAKHFAERSNIRIEFVEGATPSAGLACITLPTEVNTDYINPLLGALLHETAHIKYSGNPSDTMGKLGDTGKLCLNTLEDIRVDYLTSLKYPCSYDFVRALVTDVLERKADVLKAEPNFIKILKGLCFQADGVNIDQLYSAEVMQKVHQVAPYIKKAQACKSISEVSLLARQLLIDLLGSEEKLSQEDLEKIKGYSKQAQDNSELSKKAEEQLASSNEERTSLYESLRSNSKAIGRQQGVLRRFQKDRNLEEQKADSQEKMQRLQELDKKLAGKQAVIDALAQQNHELHQQYSKTDQDISAANQLRYDAARLVDAGIESLEKALEEAGLILNPGLSVNGFSALETSKLEKAEGYTGKSIEDLVKEALLDKRDQVVSDELGLQLNSQRLSELYTNIDALFTTRQEEHCLTKVAFVLDVSGSMGDWSDWSSLGLAFYSLDLLLKSTKEAINQGAPADVSLYAFGSYCKVIAENIESYDTERCSRRITSERSYLGSSTRLLDAIEYIQADLEQHADKKTIIIITDAQVEKSDLHALVNNTNGDCKYIFIAVNGQYSGNSIEQELFGDNNIKTKEQALEIIGRALMQAI